MRLHPNAIKDDLPHLIRKGVRATQRAVLLDMQPGVST